MFYSITYRFFFFLKDCKKNRRGALNIFFLTILTMFSGVLYAEQPANQVKLPESPVALSDMRAELQSEAYYLQDEILKIKEKIKQFELYGTDNLKRYRGELAKLKSKSNPTVNERKDIGSLEYSLFELESDSAKILLYKQELPVKEDSLKSIQTLSSKVREKLEGFLISPEQEFKKAVSMTFGALIGIVIIGFFVIAGNDENVRKAIFSGQAGIQFLTLFSLVIAIILFGITGILEGKELAALLGGLSGYILGRVTGGDNAGDGSSTVIPDANKVKK